MINVKHSAIPPLQEEQRTWKMSTWSTSRKKIWQEITRQLWSWMLKTKVATFDLDKVLCPHGQTWSFHYCKHLKLHNFTVIDILSMKIMCYMWYEVEAEKGSCEIVTALQQYIDQAVKEKKNILHFFAGRCWGQNKME